MSSLCRLLALAWLLALTGCPNGPGPGADAGSSDAVSDTDDGPSVALGTHQQWKQQPEHFIELRDDSELPIVLGHQGLWMVVLAVRSFEMLEGELDLIARIEAADTLLGELQLVNQALDPELDNHDYIYDIWLVVSDPSLATYTANLTVEIEDSNGLSMTLERTVTLSGGSL